MLGRFILDPTHVESGQDSATGLGLLPVQTVLSPEKRTVQTNGVVHASPAWPGLEGTVVSGYEIHCGETYGDADVFLSDGERVLGVRSPDGRVMGAYPHGLLDEAPLREALTGSLRSTGVRTQAERREAALAELAAVVRAHIDMHAVYRMLRTGM